MKKIIAILLLGITVSCSKGKNCPDYASNGCGCYNTGTGQYPYVQTSWNSGTQQCTWTDNLGNDHVVDKKYCPCR